ncbi:MAG: ABC transporter substrate-binding protein [Clostridia bacterium]|nr:ABC transporter substrate-binding protein [Clostridia bacterium]
MKKLFVLLLCALLCASSVAFVAFAEVKTVGIIQFAPHPSLDNCTTGFLLGLAEGGFVEGETLKVDFQNAMGDWGTSDMQAKMMVSNRYDMLVGVATPSAMSAYAATKEEGIPVVFVAVSDAVACGVVESNEAPGTNATGVSDVLNLEAQVQMIRAFLPDAETIGVIYTTSEPNSITHLAQLNAIAPEYGFTVVAQGVASDAEVASAAATLVAKGVDCINNFTDNNVVNNLALVLYAADEAGIPVFGSEVEQVVNGCLAAQGIDYVALGRVAGLMAAEILSGNAVPQTMPVGLIDECTPAYNSAVAARLGIVLPEAYAHAEDVAP